MHWWHAKAAAITSQSAWVPGEHEVPFLGIDKNHSSTAKGGVAKEVTHPRAVVIREKVVKFVRNRKICNRFAFGISCNSKGLRSCTTTYLEGTTSTSSASVGRLARPWRSPDAEADQEREIAALKLMCYKDWGQRSLVTSGSVDSDRPTVGEYVDTNSNSIDNDEGNSNDFLLAEPAVH